MDTPPGVIGDTRPDTIKDTDLLYDRTLVYHQPIVSSNLTATRETPPRPGSFFYLSSLSDFIRQEYRLPFRIATEVSVT